MQPTSRPKRRYTVTAKVLAANRVNLLKANAVAKEIRYRSTPRRKRACRANLLRAVALLRTAEAPSRAYGACFRHGLYAVSLRRSAALAGETQSEFDANLRRFERAFAPQDAAEGKLVRALARASWRRLRAFRGQANWELRSLEYRLAEAARGYPSDDFCPLTPADCDQILVDEVQGIFGTASSLYITLPKLSGRVERLLWALLEKQTGRAPEFCWFMRRRSGSLEEVLARPEAALDNPLRSSGVVAEALRSKPLSVVGTRQWIWTDLSPDLDQEARLESEGTWRGLPGEGKALRYGLMRGWSVEAGRESSQDASSPAARQRFFELFERAFDSSTDGSKNGFATTSVAGGSESQNLPEVRAAAEAAWERVEVFRRQAEQEAERLNQVLAQAVARAATVRFASPDAPKRELAAKILTVFACHGEALTESLKLEERLVGAFYNLLTARHGVRRRFAYLDPSKRPKIEDELRPDWVEAMVHFAARQEVLAWLKSRPPPSS